MRPRTDELLVRVGERDLGGLGALQDVADDGVAYLGRGRRRDAEERAPRGRTSSGVMSESPEAMTNSSYRVGLSTASSGYREAAVGRRYTGRILARVAPASSLVRGRRIDGGATRADRRGRREDLIHVSESRRDVFRGSLDSLTGRRAPNPATPL
ncbi:hypothetical protein [Catenuloplanes atrovinosus]|uniref:Uncharacterized protein n=1 Tax=Catenuloplanes atrovinosus TaxID=137266 RepID=A0AAE3YKQ9_9ACTN|nr:hypothetical protein [Catenuloplanes atrovinosus]MDR7275618.1 hypothetical protein [Catenuloplanes atrovinosus]